VKRIALVAAAAALVAAPALAQEISPRTAVSVVAGAGSATSTTGVALGGTVLFDLTDFTSIEAQGAYLDRGAGAEAFTVFGSLLVNVLPARERIVPYLAAGGGLYRASFDLGASRFMGNTAGVFAPGSTVCPVAGTGMGMGAGAGFGPGDGTCPSTAMGYWGVGRMNDFYARRLGPLVVPASGTWGTRSFADPALSLGGGIRFNVTERLMVRPDVRALVVFADGDTQPVALFGINVGYRF
jgi:hypothetical protein